MADSSLPFHIQEEIIKRIPDVKSLVRLRSVSKTWKSVIDSPLFVNDHTRRRQHHRRHLLVTYCRQNYVNNRLVYDHIYQSVVDDDDSFCQHEVRPTILNPADSSDENIEACSSTHGLVCVYPFIAKWRKTPAAVIWNPTIRKSIPIDVTIHNTCTGPYYYNTGVVGFGVCPLTLEPKLVKITWAHDDWTAPWQVEVYSLSSPGLWRSIINHNLPPRSSLQLESKHEVVDGFIYWLSTYYGDEFQGGHCKMIMSFDVTTEEFVQVYLPDRLATNKVAGGLGLSTRMNSLIVIEHTTREPWKHTSGVWKMEEHAGSTKTFTKLFNVFITSPADGTLDIVHGFRNNGEPIIEVINQLQKRGLYAYEPLLGRLIKFTGIDSDEEEEYINCVTSYTETLLLLDH